MIVHSIVSVVLRTHTEIEFAWILTNNCMYYYTVNAVYIILSITRFVQQLYWLDILEIV